MGDANTHDLFHFSHVKYIDAFVLAAFVLTFTFAMHNYRVSIMIFRTY
jgi:hypothetical protein